MSLSEEQRRRIEESRQKALAVRASRQQGVVTGQTAQISIKPFPAQPSSSLTANKPFYGSQNKNVGIISKNFSHAQPSNTRKQFTASKYSTGRSTKYVGSSTGAKVLTSYGGISKLNSTNSADLIKVKFLVVSRQRFVADVPYCAAVVEVFKAVNSRQYDAQSKMWSFDLKDYHDLEKRLMTLKDLVAVESLPAFVMRVFGNQLRTTKSDTPMADLSKVDSKLVSTLMMFQREGVNFAIRQNGRLLLADEMGLGKTLQALCVAAYYRSEWPLLIIAPSSVRFAWRQQILEWLPSVDPQEVNMVISGKDCCTSGLINILSYDLMSRCNKQLEDANIRVIIVDESHFLKNIKSSRTKKALPLLKKASRVILLSGTPAMSRPSELYTQLVAVDPVTFRYFHDYGLRYCSAKQLPWGWDYSGSSNLSELQVLLDEGVMIRRLKQDVLGQLPSKRRTMIVLDPSSVTPDKVMKSSHKTVQDSQGQKRKLALMEYFNTTGTAKIKAVVEYVLDLLEADRKFLLFAHHQEVLDSVEEAVHENNYKSIRIDGRTTCEQRGFFCNRFQSDPDVRVALLSITAANAGINLTAASLVVFAELFWNPGVMVQAEDRAHRIGQQDSVNIHYLVARNTADDYIWPLIQGKLNVLSKAGLSKDDFCDIDTETILKDKKERDLLSYFQESFIEDDSGSSLTNASEPVEGDDGSMMADQSPSDGVLTSSVTAAKKSVDTETIDWTDDDDEWYDENKPIGNGPEDSIQPLAKKSKHN